MDNASIKSVEKMEGSSVVRSSQSDKGSLKSAEPQSKGKNIVNDSIEESSLNCEQSNTEEGESVAIKETKHEERDYRHVLPEKLIDQIKGVIYGNCIGDAVGLLTEFMSKEEARSVRTISCMIQTPFEVTNLYTGIYL